MKERVRKRERETERYTGESVETMDESVWHVLCLLFGTMRFLWDSFNSCCGVAVYADYIPISQI